MFGMGMPEILLILAIALIVIGPKKLPDLAKSLGRAMNEFKKATSDFKESMELDYDLKTAKKTFEDVEKEIKKPLSPDALSSPGTQKTSEAAKLKTKEPGAGEKSGDSGAENTDTSDPESAEETGTDIPAELLAEKEEVPSASPRKNNTPEEKDNQ
jgi:TatA/E family protein of Tat protein translocase